MEHQSVNKISGDQASVANQRPPQPSRLSVQPSAQLQQALGNRAFGQFIQAKLKVSQPNDPYEQEADRVADQVLRMPAPTASAGDSALDIQRKCSACESGSGSCPTCPEEDGNDLQRKPFGPEITPLVQRQAHVEEEEEEEALQTKNGPCQGSSASHSAEGYLKGLNGGGAALPQSVRSFFEPRLGHDFSDVRIHNDGQAADAARAVNALAFTRGRDVVFGAGQYEPATTAGQKLLAHELTHVVQQGSERGMLQRFAACETPEDCPARVTGEVGRARSTPHLVQDFSSPRFGILISNFAIDERLAKADLNMSMTWINLLAHIGLAASDTWEILGFSDCKGTEATNAALRQSRADAVAALLPAAPRARVTTVSAAPTGECIGSNASESDRSLNRSVLIRRLPGSTGPTVPGPIPPAGPVRPAGAPGLFCVPFVGPLAGLDASLARGVAENIWVPLATAQFNADVGALWLLYLRRPKGSSLAPIVFRGSTNVIAEAFRTDPETVRHQGLLFTEIANAAGQTPEATIPLTGSVFSSPAIPLGTLLPQASLIRAVNYTDPATRIPGNIAGGSGTIGTGSSDAGPDLRIFTGSVRIVRSRATPTSPEVKTAHITLQLQVIDAVDFCPGAPGGSVAQEFTIPMSRLEATPTEPTYDLPFHVFTDLSGTAPIP